MAAGWHGKTEVTLVVCFGEMLLRLSTPVGSAIASNTALASHFGGAEANVAVALAGLGTRTRMVTTLPDNAIGRAAKAALGAADVDTGFVAFAPGRLGLYFYEHPAGPRAGRVTYDRTGSVFALATADQFELRAALQGAALLHLSGITPALGPAGIALARAAVDAAVAASVPVCFDGNYRANLWQAWDSNPRAILTELVSAAKIFFGNHRDLSLLLGREFEGATPAQRAAAAQAAFTAFPTLELIASTSRYIVSAGHHKLAARVDTRTDDWQTEEIEVTGIVDRIGTGDAFAAGILHRYLAGAPLRAVAESGLALAALKHGVSGDMIQATSAEVEDFRAKGSDVRR
jgi:2-dehydro-3-deoxygluconokinase